MARIYSADSLFIGEEYEGKLSAASNELTYTPTGKYFAFEKLPQRYREISRGVEVYPRLEDYSVFLGNTFIGEFEKFTEHFPEFAGKAILREEVLEMLETQNHKNTL